MGRLGGLAYAIALPAGYRLADDDGRRHRWEPASGEGMTYEVGVYPRAAEHVGEVWVFPPCEPDDLTPSRSGKGGMVDGVERDIYASLGWCVPVVRESGTTYADVACEASHTRGFIEGGEADAGLAVCRTLATTPANGAAK